MSAPRGRPPRRAVGEVAPTWPVARLPRLLLDTNVVLDVLARREPWADDAALLLSAVEAERATAAVAAHTITTLHYLLARAVGRTGALAALVRLTSLVDVVPIDRAVILEAMALGLPDLEDAVQAVCALRFGADVLVTRKPRDFRRAGVAIAAPGEVLARL